jgi:uncharacterized protein YbjQ (UPF0145 family)
MVFDFINKKLDKAYKSLSGDKVSKCQLCGISFTWHTWRNECEYCHKILCRKCVTAFSEDLNENFSIKLCDDCWETYTNGIESMIIVRSRHVGGHKTVKDLGEVSTTEWRDINDVATAIKHEAFLLGANAVLNYKYKKKKRSEETDSGGTYYYSTFVAFGKAAIIESYDNGRKIK